MRTSNRPVKPPIKEMSKGQSLNSEIGLTHEKLIGRVVTYWSKLEASMEAMIWELFQLEMEFGRIITAKLDASSRIQMLRLQAKLEYESPQLDNFEELLSKIDIIREDRNFIVHAQWGTIDPLREPIAMSVRIKSDPTAVVGETFPRTRMLATISAIAEMQSELNRWLGNLEKEHREAVKRRYESIPSRQQDPGDQRPPEPAR